MRITRPFEVHPLGRQTRTTDLIKFTNIKSDRFIFNIPTFLIRNSYFFQYLYTAQDRRWWDSIDAGKVIEHFLNREYDNSRFIHLPSLHDFHKNKDSGYDFYPIAGLERYSTPNFKALKNQESYFFKDDGHPNEQGAKLYAREILEAMKEICPH